MLGGEQPNAADLQIGATLRVLLTIGDLRPLIEGPPPRRSRGAGSRLPGPGARRRVPGGLGAGLMDDELQPAPEKRPKRNAREETRLAVAVVLAGLGTAFALLNLNHAKVNYIFGTATRECSS